MKSKSLEWVLRIAVAGEFLGHGMFAIIGKPQWEGWVTQLTGASPDLAAQLIFVVGIIDIIVAVFVLVRPVRVILLWAALWGFWTALVRPLVGEPIWDFVERFANWGAPLALLLIQGWPSSFSKWFKVRG